MKRLLVTLFALSALAGAGVALADAYQTYGSVDVLASAATLIPGHTPGNRRAVMLSNLGPNPIYCATSSAVTTSTGTYVSALANGIPGQLVLDVNNNVAIYCIAATADQAGTADTRYINLSHDSK